MVCRKAKQVNQVFGQVFSWGDAIDAAADVYNGVGQESLALVTALIQNSSYSGQC
jgi:hypothetical protein